MTTVKDNYKLEHSYTNRELLDAIDIRKEAIKSAKARLIELNVEWRRRGL